MSWFVSKALLKKRTHQGHIKKSLDKSQSSDGNVILFVSISSLHAIDKGNSPPT